MVNIKGLSKAQVLMALHNATQVIGMGALHDLRRDMTLADAESLVADGYQYYDYVYGRPLKVHLDKDEFDPYLFDRDAGEGRAAQAIQQLRDSIL